MQYMDSDSLYKETEIYRGTTQVSMLSPNKKLFSRIYKGKVRSETERIFENGQCMYSVGSDTVLMRYRSVKSICENERKYF